MWTAIFRRIDLKATRSTGPYFSKFGLSSDSAINEPATKVSSSGAEALRGEVLGLRDGDVNIFAATASAWDCTSSFSTRPPGPEPVTRLRFTPISRAKRRVAGVAETSTPALS